MTEAVWLCSKDAGALFHHVRWWVMPTERKHRLLACAICRTFHDWLSAVGRDAVEVAESAADGRTAAGDRMALAAALLDEYNRPRLDREVSGPVSLFELAARVARAVVAPGASGLSAAEEAMRGVPSDDPTVPELFRDVFGNPFRPVAFSPEWRTDTAITLARTMYEARDFCAMPILADALQDAGCDDEDVLDHCRNPNQVHVRGCWVVDLVLGKE